MTVITKTRMKAKIKQAVIRSQPKKLRTEKIIEEKINNLKRRPVVDMKMKKRKEKKKMKVVEKRVEVLRKTMTVLVIGVTQVVTIAVTVHLQKIKIKMEERVGRIPSQEYLKSSQPYGHVLKIIERPEGQENLKNM